jgi:hypothetical protein
VAYIWESVRRWEGAIYDTIEAALKGVVQFFAPSIGLVAGNFTDRVRDIWRRVWAEREVDRLQRELEEERSSRAEERAGWVQERADWQIALNRALEKATEAKQAAAWTVSGCQARLCALEGEVRLLQGHEKRREEILERIRRLKEVPAVRERMSIARELLGEWVESLKEALAWLSGQRDRQRDDSPERVALDSAIRVVGNVREFLEQMEREGCQEGEV